MAKVILHSTTTPNLFYKYNAKKQKVYVARIQVNGKDIKRTLVTSKTKSKHMLNDLKKQFSHVSSVKKESKKYTPHVDVSKLNQQIQDNSNPNNFTVNQLFKEYVAIEFPILSKQEQITRRGRFEKYILPKIGNLKISDIRYSNIQSIINYLDENKILARKTQEHIKSSIQALFTYAIKNEYINTINPCTYVKIKAYDNHKSLTLSKNELKSLFKTIIFHPKIETQIMFLFFCHGRRKSEVLNIELNELDLINNILTIPAHKSKTGKTQKHQFLSFLADLLNEYLNTFDSTRKYLFTNPLTNKPYTNIKKRFDNIKKDSGIKKRFTLHDFRHVLGTLGTNLKSLTYIQVRDSLGHGSVTTTEIYNDRKAENSSLVVGEVIKDLDIQI